MLFALLLCAAELLEEIHLVLHPVHKCACGGAVLLVRMVGSALPALACLRAVVCIVGRGVLAARNEGGGKFALDGESAEDLAARTEEVGAACERGDGVLGADVCAVCLEEHDARIRDVRQVCQQPSASTS